MVEQARASSAGRRAHGGGKGKRGTR
jgi:hypothetical protein